MERRTSVMDRVVAARTSLIMRSPFFATVALKMKLVEDPSAGTFWIDGVSIGFNPAFADKLSHKELVSVLVHEVLHVTNKHHLRRGQRDHQKWNVAADYAINPIIKIAGFSLPEDALLDWNLNGKSAEQIYRQQEQEQEENEYQDQSDENEDQDQNEIGDDESENSEKSDPESDDDSSNDDSDGESSDSENSDDEVEDDTNGDSGSDQSEDDGAESSQSDEEGNDENPAETKSDEQLDNDGNPSDDFQEAFAGEVRDFPGKSPSEVGAHEADLNSTIVQAMNAGLKAGNLPGDLEAHIKEILAPKIDWRELLHQYLSEVLRNDYTMSRPNRRHVGSGFVLPSLYNRDIGSIVLFVDTSASISEKELYDFVSEVHAIAQTFEAKIDVIYVDAQVRGHDVIEPGDAIELNPKGRGGTDFKPGFDYIEQHDDEIDPRVIIYYTDGECDSYPDEPDVDVLWVMSRKSRYYELPPFGEVTYIYN